MNYLSTFLAIDPGHKTGAIAYCTVSPDEIKEFGEYTYTLSMSDLREEYGSITEFLLDFPNPIAHISLERIPFLDTPGAAKLFANYGALLEAIKSYLLLGEGGTTFSHPTPQEWKRRFEFPGGMMYQQQKAYATHKRKELFPEIDCPKYADDSVLILANCLANILDGPEG